MSEHDILQQLDRLNILRTPQRLKIARILLEKPQHLSAEQIIERLKDMDGKVSKATVYNALKLFSERGLVKELIVDHERRFYDSTTRPHHHFYNVDTGELTDIEDGQLKISQMPALPQGTQADGVEVVIKVRSA